MTRSVDTRADLLDALRLDLVGPRPGFPPHAAYAEEVLPIAPSKWYLAGFLVPFEASADERSDDDGDDTLDQVGRAVESDDDVAPEAASARKMFFPSSMGLSVLVPATTHALRVQVAWADYLPVSVAPSEPEPDGEPAPPDRGSSETEAPAERAGRGRWRRVEREGSLDVDLTPGTHDPVGLDEDDDLKVVVSVREVNEAGLVPPGTRSVSVFLVNHRPPAPDVRRDAAYVFQPDLSLHSDQPFIARPDVHGQRSDDWDERAADLQYSRLITFSILGYYRPSSPP